MTRAVALALLYDAFGVSLTAIYQPTNSAKAWIIPVDDKTASQLRPGVYRLTPDYGFVLKATYPTAPRKKLAYVSPVTSNVSFLQLSKGIMTVPMVQAAEGFFRVKTKEGTLTEKVGLKVKWKKLELGEDGSVPPNMLGFIKGYYTQTFFIEGKDVPYELRSFPPCSYCGYTNHLNHTCPWPEKVAKAPLIELRSYQCPTDS